MFQRWLGSLRVQYTLAVTAALIGCVAAASGLLLLRQREEMLAGLRERAMPIARHGQWLAAALAARDAAWVGRELSPWLRGQDLAFAAAYDASGQLLWQRSPADGAEPLPPGETERLRARSEPLCRTGELARDGAPAYVVSLPIRREGEFAGSVRLGYPLEEVALHERVARRHAAEVCLGVVVVGVLLSYLLRRAVLRPLRRLSDEMRRVASGDLSRHIQAGTDDEVGEAARTFNEMTERLAAARAAVEGYNDALAATAASVRRELEAAQAQLLQSERLAATGRLAAGVAHEINNPLTGILVLTDCLSESCAGPAMQADLREIEAQARRCQQIVENLLAFAADQPARCEAVDLGRLLDDALDAAQRQHAHAEVRVVRDLAAGLPPLVGDPAQLAQALRNVLANAYQAMGDAGTLTLTARLAESSAPQDLRPPAIVITVADTGCGMDAEQLDKAFDPFYTTHEAGGGAGLGLSVAHGIVRRHQGRISVASRAGAGTTVTLELPAAPRRQAAVAPPQAPSRAPM